MTMNPDVSSGMNGPALSRGVHVGGVSLMWGGAILREPVMGTVPGYVRGQDGLWPAYEW